MAREHLLLVERDAKTRRLLKVSLEQAGFMVETARDGRDAIGRLEDALPDLVLTATDLPRVDGYALVRQMKDHPDWAAIPVVFLVAGESIEDKIRGLELGVEEYVSKPIFVKELLSRVQVLLAKRVRQHLSTSAADTRVRGELQDLPTIDLLESLEAGKQSGVVRIRTGEREGVVFFQDGEIVDARLKRLRGEEVVFRLLSWTHGTYEVELCDVDVEPIIESSTRALVEAGMRHAAEYHRLLEDLPPLSTVMQVNRTALRERLGNIPDEINGILKLFDSRRALADIIDESPFDDLSTLATIAKLFEEELLSVVAQGPTALDRSATPLAPEPDYNPGIEEVDDTAVTMRPPSVRTEPARVFIEGIGEAAARAAAEPFALAALESDSLGPPSAVEATPPAPAEEEGIPETPRRGGSLEPVDGDGDEDAERSTLDASPAAPEVARRRPPPARVRRPPRPRKKSPVHADEEPPATPFGHAPRPRSPLVGDEDEGEAASPVDSSPPLAALPDEEKNGDEASRREPALPEREDASPWSEGRTRADEPAGDRPLPPRGTPSEAPASGASALSQSGISAGFFAADGAPAPDSRDELPPSSRDAPVYLSEAQVARKETGRKIVMAVVGMLVAVVLFAVVRSQLQSDGDERAASTARPAATAPGNDDALARPAAAGGADARAEPKGGAEPAPEAEAPEPALPEVDDPLAEALRLLGVGKYQEAIPMAEAAVAREPDNGDAYYFLATALEGLGQYDESKRVKKQCREKATRGQYKSFCR